MSVSATHLLSCGEDFPYVDSVDLFQVGTLTAIGVGTLIGRIRGSMKTTILSLLLAGGFFFSLLALVSLQVTGNIREVKTLYRSTVLLLWV